MKKLFSTILVLGLLLGGNAYAKEILLETRDELLSSENHPTKISQAIKTLATKQNEEGFTETISEFLNKRDKFLYILEYKLPNKVIKLG